MRNIVILLVVAATAINLIYWLSRSPDAANTPTSVEPTTSTGEPKHHRFRPAAPWKFSTFPCRSAPAAI
ncbi:MAG: hypothetical protein R3F38_06800 [Gammaproteobacteria bacterium]